MYGKQNGDSKMATGMQNNEYNFLKTNNKFLLYIIILHVT